MALGYQNPFYLKQAQQKQQSLYNGKVLLEKHDPPAVYDSEETLQLAQETDESLAKHKALKFKIEHLLRAVVIQDIISILQNLTVVKTSDLQTELERTKERFENCIIKKENEYAKVWNDWYKNCEECKYDKISYDKVYNDMQQKNERLQAQLGDLKGKSKDTPCVSNTLDPLSQKLENENMELESRKHSKTRRPQPRSNIKNDRVPSASKSLCIKYKDVEVEEHHRNLLLSKNNVLNYVNGMNSRDDKHSANVSKISNQKKHTPQVKKPKKVGSKERLALPKPSKTRICLRWSPTGRIFDLKGKIFASNESECQSNCSKGENACTSNHQEPASKRFPNSTFSLAGTVCFGNDHIAAILGYGDLQWGNILITKVYFIEVLGHNLFSVG
ncbi:hypothetical protein Tco_0088954 [Tanacetum coccineum]